MARSITTDPSRLHPAGAFRFLSATAVGLALTLGAAVEAPAQIEPGARAAPTESGLPFLRAEIFLLKQQIRELADGLPPTDKIDAAIGALVDRTEALEERMGEIGTLSEEISSLAAAQGAPIKALESGLAALKTETEGALTALRKETGEAVASAREIAAKGAGDAAEAQTALAARVEGLEERASAAATTAAEGLNALRADTETSVAEAVKAAEARIAAARTKDIGTLANDIAEARADAGRVVADLRETATAALSTAKTEGEKAAALAKSEAEAVRAETAKARAEALAGIEEELGTLRAEADARAKAQAKPIADLKAEIATLKADIAEVEALEAEVSELRAETDELAAIAGAPANANSAGTESASGNGASALAGGQRRLTGLADGDGDAAPADRAMSRRLAALEAKIEALEAAPAPAPAATSAGAAEAPKPEVIASALVAAHADTLRGPAGPAGPQGPAGEAAEFDKEALVEEIVALVTQRLEEKAAAKEESAEITEVSLTEEGVIGPGRCLDVPDDARLVQATFSVGGSFCLDAMPFASISAAQACERVTYTDILRGQERYVYPGEPYKVRVGEKIAVVIHSCIDDGDSGRVFPARIFWEE